MKTNLTLSLLSLIAVSAASAFADSTTTAAPATSTATAVEAKAPSLLDKINVQYVGQLNGPSVADPINSKTLTPDGEQDGTISLDNSLRVHYKFGTMKAGIGANFSLFPGNAMSEKLDAGKVMLDPDLRLGMGNILSSDNLGGIGEFSMSNTLRAYLPVSAGSRDKDQITQLRADQSTSLSFGKSGASLSLDTTERYYIYASNDSASVYQKAYRYRFYGAPAMNYSFSDAISVSLPVEAEWGNKVGSGFTTMEFLDGDIAPNVAFTIGNWTLNPSITIPVFNDEATASLKKTVNSSTLGLVVVGTIL